MVSGVHPAACFAAVSAASLLGIPLCAGIHLNSELMPLAFNPSRSWRIPLKIYCPKVLLDLRMVLRAL